MGTDAMLLNMFRTPLTYLALVSYAVVFSLGQDKRSHYRVRLIAVLGIFFACSYALSEVYPLEYSGIDFELRFAVYYLTILLETLISVRLLYHVTLAAAVFVTVSAYILEDLATAIKVILDNVPIIGPLMGTDLLPFFTFIFVRLVFVIILYFTLGPRLRAGVVVMEDQARNIFSLSVIFCLLVVARVAGLLPRIPQVTLTITLYKVICDLLILYLQFYILSDSQKQGQISNLSHILDSGQRQSKKNQQVEEELKLLVHDLKNRALMYRIPEAAEEDAVSDFDSQINSGNKYFDIIVAEKNRICGKYGIEMACMADGKLLDFIDPSDLCALLGNALDNAIEGAKKTEERCISICVKSRGDMISIHIENSMPADDLTIRKEDLLPATTKSDPGKHGYGMTSMRNITEKYKGTFSFSARGNRFVINILFVR